ncbi:MULTISPECIES: integrase arm-type DNA-binding domain-containing protein [Diaphorobacter]|uniref:Integrase family protein n=1 Tax=Acidovorax ebreus (strain TPSY) TaxID=535289 RepID=A0A9J9QDY7_ACIET|nr:MULTISPECIES: integrase arm-type DNA-binding domain-containing protein [Diaphorobacter]ACM33036.1 integrase family protein [[Acidovorax] ebreus TPSY]
MLSDTACRAAKAQEKPAKLSDSGGLYLLVNQAGKYWRWDYRHAGKRKTLALGVYPGVTLATARKKRDDARALLVEGVDPGEARKAQKAALFADDENTFEAIMREWHALQAPKWSPRYAEKMLARFVQNVFPYMGSVPIADMTPSALLAVVRKLEARGLGEVPSRTLSECGQVMRYAVATGRAERDITADLRGALAPMRTKHLAAVTEPEKVGPLLRVLDDYDGTATVRCALRLAPLLFVRPGELRSMRWADIDFEACEWRYLVTKTQTRHIVPLSRQTLAILEEIRPITGRGVYVFPSARTMSPAAKSQRPMSDNAILAALRRAGIDKDEMTGHGFRAMARTILDEVLGFRPDFIEHQLAHAVRDPNGRAYNRTAHLPARHEMMQQWADYLDKLKTGADVVKLRANS